MLWLRDALEASWDPKRLGIDKRLAAAVKEADDSNSDRIRQGMQLI